MSSKHADRTYIDPPASLPRRGVPPPPMPSMQDLGRLDYKHLTEWRNYVEKLECTFRNYQFIGAIIDQHLAAERSAAQLGAKESADELIRRAALPSQWVLVQREEDADSVGIATMWQECESRCCQPCNKREYKDPSRSRRLYGTRICIGESCYDRLVKEGVVPRLSVPTTVEMKDAIRTGRTDDPFIVCGGQTMDGYTTLELGH